MVSFVYHVNLLYFTFVGLFRFSLRVHMYLCIFSHTFYCCYKPLPLRWAFTILWSFPFSFFFLLPFFSFLFYNFNFLNLLYFSIFIPLFFFPTVLFPLQLILMYINLLHPPLFNCAYLFFLFFLSFPLNIFVSFAFIALVHTWHLALVLFSSLCLS